jgi:hypothetical protein
VRTEPPAGGVCNFEWTGGSRFTWLKATSVEISATSFPARTTFTDVRRSRSVGLATAISLACTLTSASSAPTINDLALGPDDRVYALSAQTRMIARLEQHLEPGQRARATDTWRIDGQTPAGHDARPEGLAILP